MKLRLLFSLFSLITLVSLNAQITTVGIIGTATPNGWNDPDTDMVQHPDSAHLWSLNITLVAGEAKFRANDAWTINWGNNTFPVGVGVQEGDNVSVPAGTYDISFNSNTGAYYFAVVSDIGIIGSATPFGWNADVNMFPDEVDPNLYSLTLNLVAGEAKFRQNDDWAVNWGSSDFPSGIGTQNGDNIPIALGGDYLVTFNKSTGAYNFQLVSFSTVGVIGNATPGGDTPTPLTQNSQNPKQWDGTLHLNDGGLQFSGDNGLVVWGGSDFPSGIATIGGGSIPITAGNWVITFNSQTGAYSFTGLEIYETIGIIGDATPGGWDNDTDMIRGADSSVWSLRVVLNDGEAKFRANDEWVVDWGGATFPTGIAEMFGPNIPITAGEYNILFNSFTGAYNFVLLVIPDRVGLVGAGTPLMSWDVDFFLTQDPNDENVWTYSSIDLNGEVKFRADSSWTVNWGPEILGEGFPSGIGIQDGENIMVPAGTYGITFNSASGEYIFSEPLATKDVLNPSSIKAYPNPADNQLNLDLDAIQLTGEVVLNVFDISGKLVHSETQLGSTFMSMNVAHLQNGHYSLHISNDKYIIGKKFVIAR